MNSNALSPSRPVRLEIKRQQAFQALQLTGYLSGAVGAAAFLAAPQAEAAVTLVTFGCGPVLNVADGTGYFTAGAFGNLWGTTNGSELFLGFSVYQNHAYNASNGLASFFANGTVIGAGTNTPGSALGQGWFQSPAPSRDFASDQLNQNIGFKTSTNNWGWANVSWDETLKNLTINEAWVESTPNAPITISAAPTPEPSRALLALAGLGSVALRRRRKQAA